MEERMSLWDALKQYISDAAPGGVLNPELQGVRDYAGRVATGDVAKEGLNRYQGLLDAAIAGDSTAGKELIAEMIPGGGILGSIAGKAAKTADSAMLRIANDAINKGLPANKVYDATGWWKGADNKWRFEIDDSGTLISDDVLDGIKQNKRYDGTFNDALPHPSLKKAYPNVAETKSTLYADKMPTGSYSRHTNKILAGGGKHRAAAQRYAT